MAIKKEMVKPEVSSLTTFEVLDGATITDIVVHALPDHKVSKFALQIQNGTQVHISARVSADGTPYIHLHAEVV